MRETQRPRDDDDLLAQDRFIRGLARALVLDPHRADDVAQTTWLAALTHRPPVDGLRAWLATLVRHFASNVRRGDARTSRRERAAARPDRVPSVLEAREKEETRRGLVDAVFALEEPYRTTLVLRFIEGLPPRVIARHQGTPVETVNTRLRRGIEQLRRRLDRGHDGSRAQWCSALAPLAWPASTANALSLATVAGALIVTTKIKLVLAVLACAAVSLALWGIGRDAGPTPTTTPSRADERADPTRVVSPVAATETRREPVVTKAATVPLPAAASLLVRTCWRDTMAPAAQIGVSVLRPARDAGVEIAAVSDAGGFTRFSGLTPGPAQVLTDRGAHAEVALDAGRECELTLLLETGFELEGTVVDEQGGPVPDARIWLEPNPLPDLQALRANAQAVAVTDGQGAFRIRGLADKQDVWARKPGHAPSARHYVLRGQRALEIVLPGAGAAVQGRVQCQGQPISGAALRVWPARREPPYTATERGAPYATATADREGRFRIDDLPAGATRVQVRAAGYARHLASVELPALGRADVTLELEPAATLHGSVTSALGGALAGAQVTVTRPDELQGASATVAGDGSYRIDDAPFGAARVTFARRGYATSCRSLVLGGEATRCDAVLQPEPAVRGRLQDEAGRPLAGWNVMGYVLGGRSHEWERARSDASGRFRLTAHRGAGYGLRVTDPEAPFRWIRCEGLPPLVADAPQVTITIGTHQRPSAFVSGRLVDEKGTAVGGAGLRLADDLGVLLGPPERTAADGTFRIGPLAPSTYQVSTREFDTTEVPPVDLARFEVHPGEKKDLGTLRIARDSKLAYRFLDPEGQEIAGLHAFVGRSDGEEIATLTRGGAGRGEQQLPPGTYWLEATSPERAWAARSPHAFTVRAGETTRLELRFVRASPRTLRLGLPSEAGPVEDQRVTIRIDHPHGETLETRSWLAGGGADPLVTFGLGLGAHRIVLTLPNGLELAGRFTVAGDRGEDLVTPVVLTRLR